MSLAEYGLTPEEAGTVAVAGRILQTLLTSKMTPDEHAAFNDTITRLDDEHVKRVHIMANALLVTVASVVLAPRG